MEMFDLFTVYMYSRATTTSSNTKAGTYKREKRACWNDRLLLLNTAVVCTHAEVLRIMLKVPFSIFYRWNSTAVCALVRCLSLKTGQLSR